MNTDDSRHSGTDYHHDRPDRAYEPRRVPLSGDVSPDGTRPWPRTDRKSRLLVWGAVAGTAAVATVGILMAVKSVVDHITDDKPARPEPKPRPPQQPLRQRAAFADPDSLSDEIERAPRSAGPRPPSGTSGMRRRRPASGHPSSPPPSGPRRRPSSGPRPRMAEANATLAEMSTGVSTLLANVTAAMEGFRRAAGQAGHIADEFHSTADKIRTVLDRGAASVARQRAEQARKTAAEAEDDAAEPDLARDDERTHRL